MNKHTQARTQTYARTNTSTHSRTHTHTLTYCTSSSRGRPSSPNGWQAAWLADATPGMVTWSGVIE